MNQPNTGARRSSTDLELDNSDQDETERWQQLLTDWAEQNIFSSGLWSLENIVVVYQAKGCIFKKIVFV